MRALLRWTRRLFGSSRRKKIPRDGLVPDWEAEDHVRIFNRLIIFSYAKKEPVLITPSGDGFPLSDILPPELAAKYGECYDDLCRFIERLCQLEGADAGGTDCEAEFMMGDEPATVRFTFERGGIRISF